MQEIQNKTILLLSLLLSFDSFKRCEMLLIPQDKVEGDSVSGEDDRSDPRASPLQEQINLELCLLLNEERSEKEQSETARQQLQQVNLKEKYSRPTVV